MDGPVVVWNALAHKRSDIVTATLDEPVGAGVRVLDSDGTEVPAHVEHGGRLVSWLARDVPSLGWQSYRLAPADAADGWEPLNGNEIGNTHYRLRVDPARGGGVVSLVEAASGRELIAGGKVGNELAVYDEYPAHPEAGEGPWHLLPKGPVVCSSTDRAQVRAYRGPLGERVVVTGRIGDLLRYKQTLTLWHDVARVECRTTVDEFTGADRLLRLRWPCPVPGALPVSEVGDAVIGRGFGLMHEGGGESAVDSAVHPWTLDNPAYGWFGLSSAVRVRVGSADARQGVRAVSVAEVVSPTESASAPLARPLMVALARAGVTATCSGADHPRYGDLAVDSNLPDARIALGGPDQNAFTAAVLARGRCGLCRGARASALVNRPRQGMGAARRSVGRRVGPGRGPAPGACAAGARHRRIGPRGRGGIRGRGPRRLRDRRRPGGAICSWSPSSRTPSRCSTAECPDSPSISTAPCTPR